MMTKSSPKRLVLVSGSWQLTIVTAALRQISATEPRFENHLVICPHRQPAELKTLMTQMANVFGDWSSLIWVKDALPTRPSRTTRPVKLAELREEIGLESVDEVWVYRPTDHNRHVALAFPDAKIVLYEDGVGTYVAPPALDAGTLRPNYAYVYAIRLFKVPAFLDGVPTTEVSSASLQGVFADFKASKHYQSPTSGLGSSAKRLLFAASNFHRSGWLSADYELALYRRIVMALILRGYTVLWRDHPRAESPFSTELRKNIPSGRLIVLDASCSLPIEYLIDDLDIDGCVGITSSALYTIPLLYGIPTYSAAHWVEDWQKEDYAARAATTLRRITPIEQVLQTKYIEEFT